MPAHSPCGLRPRGAPELFRIFPPVAACRAGTTYFAQNSGYGFPGMFCAGIVHAYCLVQGGHVNVRKSEQSVRANFIARLVARLTGSAQIAAQ